MTTSIQEENKKLEAQRKKNRNRRIREVLAKKDSKKNLLEQQLKNAKTLTQLSSVYRKGALFFHSNKGGY